MIVKSNVLYLIFQTCWACVFIVLAPGVKDTEACVCEEAIFSASSEERERRFYGK